MYNADGRPRPRWFGKICPLGCGTSEIGHARVLFTLGLTTLVATSVVFVGPSFSLSRAERRASKTIHPKSSTIESGPFLEYRDWASTSDTPDSIPCSTEKGRSYYSPGSDTIDLVTGPFETPIVLEGERLDLIVACDWGRCVYGIVGGEVAWRRDYSGSWPRAVAVFENLLFCANGPTIEIMNPYSGHLHRTLAVPDSPGAINGISVTRFRDQIWMILCFDQKGPGSVRGYHLYDLNLLERFVNPYFANHPRHAELSQDGWVFVCDTFGRQVYAVSLVGRMQVKTDVYFPNHVQVLPDHTVLITAEHENRIFKWKYFPVDGREMVMSAPVAPFNDIHARCEDIGARESATIDPKSPLIPPKSLCAVEGSGPATLYSPNSARLIGKDLLVADTDNHRVVVFRDGFPVTTMTGFNNPVTAILLLPCSD